MVSQLDRRHVLKLFGTLAAAGATGAVSACTSTPPGTQMERPSGLTIKIGLVSPATGPFARSGADISNGFKLYLADHEGLLGRHNVDLRVQDEGATAASAKAAVDSLLNQDVIAVAGIASATSLAAARDLVEKAKVPMVCSNASPSTLASSFYTWRVSYVEGQAGRALAPYIYGDSSKAYVLHDDTASSAAEAQGFVNAFEDLGGTVVANVADSGDPGLRMQQVRSSGASVLFCAYTGTDALQLLDAFRTAGSGIRLVGPAALTETVELGRLTALPDRVFTASNYASDLDNEDNRRFVASYHKAYGVQPSSTAMAGYDTASVLNKALRLMSGVPNAVDLNRALGLLGQIDSPRGLWTFSVNRTPQQKWYLRQLRLDGQVPANLLNADLAVLS
jgi:branched-chain amino acid transport system substrate-binding protein